MSAPVQPVVLALGGGDLGLDSALLPLGGMTLLQRLLRSLETVGTARPVVVVHGDVAERCTRIVGHQADVQAAPGGSRLDALAAGLRRTAGAGDVLVHEAERALTDAATITAVLDGLDEGVDAVAPGIPVTDSVKARGPHGLANVDRSTLVELQCPRLLRRDLLTELLETSGAGADDEIEAALARGARVRVVGGSHRGGAVTDRLRLWEAQIALGLARDTSRLGPRAILR